MVSPALDAGGLNSGKFRSAFEKTLLELAKSSDVPYVDFSVEKVGLSDDVMPRYLLAAYKGGNRMLTEEFYFDNIRGEVVTNGPRLRL